MKALKELAADAADDLKHVGTAGPEAWDEFKESFAKLRAAIDAMPDGLEPDRAARIAAEAVARRVVAEATGRELYEALRLAWRAMDVGDIAPADTGAHEALVRHRAAYGKAGT